MGAVAADAQGREEGVAIGRFVRSKTDPGVAEVAVAVVDDWQRRGLGTLLLLRLAAAARERKIERFGGQALVSNQAIRDVLSELPGVRLHEDANGLAVDVDLPDVPFDALLARDEHAPARRLLGLVARGLLRLGEALEKLAGAGGKTA